MENAILDKLQTLKDDLLSIKTMLKNRKILNFYIMPLENMV